MALLANYRGDGRQSKQADVERIDSSRLDRHTDPSGYYAEPGLIDAVNVAIYLGQPLLLTGDPGSGKTQLAYSVAWELGLGPVLRFDTKSSSKASELLYRYDALRHFRDSQIKQEAVNALDYIEFEALGLAILRAGDPQVRRELGGEGFAPARSVVLVDEIDKAPRDFPNDLLNEVERFRFRVSELANREVVAEPSMRPIVIITSNSEKHLPDAFLRRCVFYDVKFPERKRLTQIVISRLADFEQADRPLLEEAVDLLLALRDPAAGLIKTPSIAEFLGWLQVISELELAGLKETGPAWRGTLSVLVKNSEDRESAERVLETWCRTSE